MCFRWEISDSNTLGGHMKEGNGSYCEELGTTAGLVLDFGIFYFKWLALYLMLSLCFTFSFYYLYLIMGMVSS